MELVGFGSAIADETRLRLITIIHEEGPLTSKEVHGIFIHRYENRRRESIYKALEKLVDAGILNKKYQGTQEGLVYELPHEKVTINLTNRTLDFQ